MTTLVFSGGYDVVNWVLGWIGYTLVFPRWSGLVVAGIALVAAQFLAFRDMRTQRNNAVQLLERLQAGSNETLDVRLEGTFSGTFSLHAHGDACEIRIGPIAIDASRIGTQRDGQVTGLLIYPRQTLEFPIVSGLRDSVLPLEPILLSWEGHGRSSSTWPKPGTAEAMKQFLHALWLVGRYRAAQSVLGHDDIDFRSNQFDDAELELFTERLQQPSEIAFDITYWNSERTLNWKRTEQLVFEPPTNTAFVRHVGRPVLIGRSEAAKMDAS